MCKPEGELKLRRYILMRMYGEIHNVLSEKVYSQPLNSNSQLPVNLSTQPSGMYFYRVLNEVGALFGEEKLR